MDEFGAIRIPLAEIPKISEGHHIEKLGEMFVSVRDKQ